MSGYPPPPPPPQGFPGGGQPQNGPYGRFDKAAWRAQRQAMKQQARMQRQQMQWQRRAMRRGSLVGPLLLVTLGIVFLLAQTGKVSWPRALDWFGTWWPLVLIGAGVLLVVEWMVDQQLRGNDPQRAPRSIGGGVIFLLILVAITGVSVRGARRAYDWGNSNLGSGNGIPFWSFALGDKHELDDTTEGTIAPGGALLIRNPYGDVTVNGSSDDGQVHVDVHKEIRARSDEEAESKRKSLQPVFSGTAQSLVLEVPSFEGSHSDITVRVPHDTTLTVNAERGTIDVQEIHAPVTVSASKGEVNVSGITGVVNAHLNSQDAAFSAHSVNGPVTLEGHAGDMNVSDIQGTVTLAGEFWGTTHVERVNGAVTFHTNRTQFQAARIDGELEIESGSDLQANAVMGPVLLHTAYRNITLDRVQGKISVSNRDGSVTVTNAPPMGQIDIDNKNGSVEVGLPEKAGFVVNAQTNHGDIDNEFGLKEVDNDHNDSKALNGTVGSGGPTVRIQTTDGDVTVRKSAVEPLPPSPPPPPKITMVPPPPASLKAPKEPKEPKIKEPKVKAPKEPPPPSGL